MLFPDQTYLIQWSSFPGTSKNSQFSPQMLTFSRGVAAWRGYQRSRPGGRGQGPRGRGGYAGYRSARFSDCEYCYVQAKVHGKNVDFRHNIKTCPQLTQLFQPGVNFVNEMIDGEGHPFDTAFEEEYDDEASYDERGFYGATQWLVAATPKIQSIL